MSLLKKLGAVALGTATLAIGAAGAVVSGTMKKMGEKTGDSRYDDFSDKINSMSRVGHPDRNTEDGIITKGFKKSIELWKDDD